MRSYQCNLTPPNSLQSKRSAALNSYPLPEHAFCNRLHPRRTKGSDLPGTYPSKPSALSHNACGLFPTGGRHVFEVMLLLLQAQELVEVGALSSVDAHCHIVAHYIGLCRWADAASDISETTAKFPQRAGQAWLWSQLCCINQIKLNSEEIPAL